MFLSKKVSWSGVYALTAFLWITFSLDARAQVGIGTDVPHSSAQLEVKADSKGILIPRLTASQRNEISSPAEGLLVYQTNNGPGFYFYRNGSWERLATNADGAGGNTILHGTGDPWGGIGKDGDFYINLNTSTFFGPKERGVWPSKGILMGTTPQDVLSNGTLTIRNGTGAALNPIVIDLADNAVTTSKIADGAVTNTDLDKSNIPLSGFGEPVKNISMGDRRITNLADPTRSQDAATKKYVDEKLGSSEPYIPSLSLDAAQNLSIRGGNAVSLADLYQSLSLTGTTLSISGPRNSHVDLAGLLPKGAGGVVATDTVVLRGTGLSGSPLTIADGGVTLPKISAIPSGTILGNISGLSASPASLTFADLKAMLALSKADIGLDQVDNTADASKNVLSATKLTTARMINGVPFDGTADITIITNDPGKQDADDDLTALSNLSGAGLVVRTGAGTAITRTLTAGTGVNITDGNGVFGNPVIGLTNTSVVPGAYTNASITVDEQGRITAASNGSGGGGAAGTVTNVGVSANNGILASVTDPTSNAALTLGLGNITPASVTTSGNISAAGTVTGSNINAGATVSGTNTGDQRASQVPIDGITGVTGANVQDALADLKSQISTAASGGLTSVSHDGTLTGSGTSGSLLGLANGAVTSAKIGDGQVTDAKLATGISASKITGNIAGNAANVTGVVAIANGGTGATTKEEALNALLPDQASQNGKILQTDGSNALWVDPPAAGGSGTVTSVGVTGNTGITASVSNASSTPQITLSLGAITPASVAATGIITGSNLSGTNTGDQTAAQVPITAISGVSGTNVQDALADLKSQISTAASGGLTSVSHDGTLTGSGTSGSLLGLANGAVTSAKIGDGQVTDAKLATGISASKITGNIAGNAANVTGVVAIANGGTGATTKEEALNALLPDQASQNGKILQTDGTNAIWVDPPAPGSSGTVSTVSVVSANGITGSVANPTTTPAITLTLGAITPTSVEASGTVRGSNIASGATVSGNNTGDQRASQVPIDVISGVSGTNVQDALEDLKGQITAAAGGGLSSVATDVTLNGSGTSGSPLALADSAVVAGKIKANAITTAKISAQAVNPKKLAGLTTNGSNDQVLASDGNGNFKWINNTATVADSAVTDAKIKANAVTTAKISAQAVNPKKLTGITTYGTNGQVLSSNGSGGFTWTTPVGGLTSVTTDATLAGNGTSGSALSLADSAVVAGKIKANAITTAKISAQAVNPKKLAGLTTNGSNDQVLASDGNGNFKWINNTATVADSAVTDAKIKANAVTTAKISAQAINPKKLTGITTYGTNGQVLSSNGSGGFTWTTPVGGLTSVTTDATLAGSGTSGSALSLADSAVVAGKIKANAITTAKISAQAVNPKKLAGLTTNGSNDQVLASDGNGNFKWINNTATVADSAVTDAKIKANAVTTAKISAQAVNPKKLTGITTYGTNGQVLSSNGSGGFTWTTPAGGLSSVTTDATLVGSGTSGSALSLADSAVVAGKIKANAITTAKISAQAVNPKKLAGLTTNGSNDQVLASDGTGKFKWTAGIPDQAGQNGKFLTTDGTSVSWTSPPAGGGGGGSMQVYHPAGNTDYLVRASGPGVTVSLSGSKFTITVPTGIVVDFVRIKATSAIAASGTSLDFDITDQSMTINTGLDNLVVPTATLIDIVSDTPPYVLPIHSMGTSNTSFTVLGIASGTVTVRLSGLSNHNQPKGFYVMLRF